VPIHASREIRSYVSGFALDEPQEKEGKAEKGKATSEINQSQERTRVGEDTIHTKMLKGHHSVLKSTP
jgi:hypothetical protein